LEKVGLITLGYDPHLSKILRAKTWTCHSRGVKHHQGKKKAKNIPSAAIESLSGGTI